MKDILVYISNGDGTLKSYYKELLSVANRLAGSMNAVVRIVGVSLSDEIINEANLFAAGEVHNYALPAGANFDFNKSNYIASMFADTEQTKLILFSSADKEIAPMISAKLDIPYIADVMEISINGDTVRTKKSIISGKAVQEDEITYKSAVLSLRAKMFAIAEGEYAKLEVIAKEAVATGIEKIELIEQSPASQKQNISEADRLVAVGRGMKAPEDHALIANLAEKMNAAVAASRAIVDNGWRPHSEQVGQTGKVVSPDLYVACGISGAIQHLAGMNTAKVIVAINSDKDAPIFSNCDYGIVGDMYEVIPQIMELL